MSSSKAAGETFNAIRRMMANSTVTLRIGKWVSTESVDANLSTVAVGNATYRFIPKLESVSPSANDTVLMIASPSSPMIIIGVLVGNITLATDGSASGV